MLPISLVFTCFDKELIMLCCLCRPVIKLLRLVDGTMAVMGKVYHGFFQVQEHIKALPGMPEDRREEVLSLFTKRWEQGHSLLHAAGYALDPDYREHDFENEVQISYMHSSCYT